MFGWNTGTARTAVMAGLLAISLAGCGAQPAQTAEQTATPAVESQTNAASEQTGTTAQHVDSSAVVTAVNASSDGAMSTADLFTERDLTQTPDLAGATSITLKDGEDVSITNEGTYVISGTATNATITVNADDTAKVQLVLDGVSITNDDSAAIYVVSADKVFVTTTQGSTNTLSVTGTFAADGTTNVDATIFSKDDLVLNGLGTLKITSTQNGVSCKDELKVTGGTYEIDSTADAFEANEAVLIADGAFTITSGKDAIHAEYDEDDTTGNVYIAGGSLNITAADDGIQATCVTQVDGGTLQINAAEGIEGTYVQINDGNVSIGATDDGINATAKSSALSPVLEIRGGEISVDMGAGDTDALDSNGDLRISGGTVTINAQFAFDFDGAGELTGGTVTVNGEQITALQNSMMGGGMGGGPMGGMRGGMGGPMGGDMDNMAMSS